MYVKGQFAKNLTNKQKENFNSDITKHFDLYTNKNGCENILIVWRETCRKKV